MLKYLTYDFDRATMLIKRLKYFKSCVVESKGKPWVSLFPRTLSGTHSFPFDGEEWFFTINKIKKQKTWQRKEILKKGTVP